MRERLRWLGHVLQMKNDRLPEIVLGSQTSRGKQKAGRPGLGWEGVKKKALNRLGWRRNMRSSVDLRWFCAAVSC